MKKKEKLKRRALKMKIMAKKISKTSANIAKIMKII